MTGVAKIRRRLLRNRANQVVGDRAGIGGEQGGRSGTSIQGSHSAGGGAPVTSGGTSRHSVP